MLERLIDHGAPPLRVLVQGATGRIAQRHIARMRAAGTDIVAGVSRRGAGERLEGVPVFATCAEAVAETGAEASVLMVPPLAVLPASREALENGVALLVTVAEGMPVRDAMDLRAACAERGARWIGASTPGVAVPGRVKLGFLPDMALAPGPVALWSKSGTLSYEIGHRLVAAGLGQSAWIGVGGDMVKGTRFADLVAPFRHHAPTRAIVVVGEIGGTEEEELAATLVARPLGKPVYAVLAGATAPEGRTLGHAGAMLAGGAGSVASKAGALEAAGVRVFGSLAPMIETILTDLAEAPA